MSREDKLSLTCKADLERDTVHVIRIIIDIERDAIGGEILRFGTREYCAVVTLDVRNAFRSANWGRIMGALFNMATPPYLLQILNNYFQDRKVIHLTDEGEQESVVTVKESVLWLQIWKIIYEGVILKQR